MVEANTALLPVLKANRHRNHCEFGVLNAALAYGAREATFYIDDSFNEGSIHRETSRSITVPATTLRDLLKRSGLSRISLICDIEGTELELVQKEGDVLREHVEWLIVEIHSNGNGSRRQTQAELDELGFRLVEQSYHNYAYHNRRMAT